MIRRRRGCSQGRTGAGENPPKVPHQGADGPDGRPYPMNRLTLTSLFFLVVLTGCGTSTAPTSASAIRNYNGTASVGDFLTITLNSTASTIDYTNHTNG